jgi:hypothetical protein
MQPHISQMLWEYNPTHNTHPNMRGTAETAEEYKGNGNDRGKETGIT